MTNLTAEQARANTVALAKQMRTLANDMQHRLDEFREFVDSMDTAIADESVDARRFTDPMMAVRMLEMVESITHIHTGSTDHSHYRELRDSIVKNTAGDTTVARGW